MAFMQSISNQTPKAALRALEATREAVRVQAHSFSAETWRFWRDLESEMDIKLQDVEHRLALGGALVAETVSARVGELRRALEALLNEHSHTHVHSLMTADVKTCHPSDTLDRAAKILWDADCGAIPVVDDAGKVVGMITDRDICMASYTRNAPLASCTVASTMSSLVYACSPHDSIQSLVELMSKHQLRRVPVTAPDGTLNGIVSISDLARYLNGLPEEHPSRALLVPAVAAISERRPAPLTH